MSKGWHCFDFSLLFSSYAIFNADPVKWFHSRPRQKKHSREHSKNRALLPGEQGRNLYYSYFRSCSPTKYYITTSYSSFLPSPILRGFSKLHNFRISSYTGLESLPRPLSANKNKPISHILSSDVCKPCLTKPRCSPASFFCKPPTCILLRCPIHD